jgi:hypothetical protein
MPAQRLNDHRVEVSEGSEGVIHFVVSLVFRWLLQDSRERDRALTSLRHRLHEDLGAGPPYVHRIADFVLAQSALVMHRPE